MQITGDSNSIVSSENNKS